MQLTTPAQPRTIPARAIPSVFVPGWDVACHSQQGAGHEKENADNQDDAQVWCSQDSASAALVISDGHGSPTSFRSAIGSKLAGETGLYVLKKYHDVGLFRRRVNDVGILRSRIAEHLPRAFHTQWRRAVDKHLRAHAFTEQEMTELRRQDDEASVRAVQSNPYLAYGATFLGAIVTPLYMAFMQLGDGDILYVTCDDRVVRPLRRNDELVGDATTSLCMRDAASRFEVACELIDPSTVPSLIFASTDGYSNSLPDGPAFEAVVRGYDEKIRAHGLQAVVDRLPKWLSQVSRNGSNDDISVGLIARRDASGSDSTRILI